MNNWSQVEQLVGVAETSTGSATQKMETYLDSLQAKLNEVKAAWEGFLLSLNQNDSIKGILDFVIFLINNLPTVISLVVSLAGAMKAFQSFNSSQNRLASIDALNQIIQALGVNVNEVTTKTIANTTATKAGTTAFSSAAKVTSTLSTAMSGLSLGIGLVTAAFALIQIGTLAYEKHMDNLKESVEEASNAISDIQTNIDSLNSAMASVTEINTKLNEGQLTTQERNQELDSIKQNLISTYGEEAEALDLVNSKYEDQIKQLDNLKLQSLYKQKQEIQNVRADKNELLNRQVNTVMGVEDNYYGLSKDTQQDVWKIIQDNNMKLTERTFADQIAIEGRAEDQVKVYKELIKLQEQLIEEGKESDAQRISNMLNSKSFGGAYGQFQNLGMKEEYEKSGGDSLDILFDNNEKVIDFQINANKQLSEYRAA